MLLKLAKKQNDRSDRSSNVAMFKTASLAKLDVICGCCFAAELELPTSGLYRRVAKSHSFTNLQYYFLFDAFETPTI